MLKYPETIPQHLGGPGYRSEKGGLRCGRAILSPLSNVLVACGARFSHGTSLKWFTDRLAVDPATASQAGSRCDHQTMEEQASHGLLPLETVLMRRAVHKIPKAWRM